MPLVQVSMIEGRSEEQKAHMIYEMCQAISNSIGAPKDTIRIILNEIPSENWGIAGVTAKKMAENK